MNSTSGTGCRSSLVLAITCVAVVVACAAAQEFRSVNGQIEFILQRAVNDKRKGRENRDVDHEKS